MTLDDNDRPPTVTVHAGDCRDVLAQYPDNHFASVVCDPPYGLGFMGKGWDKGVPGVEFWQIIGAKMRPGAYLVAFGGTRTYHRLTCAIEDAGLEIRDCLSWLYGSGFPKSLNVSKAVDKRRDWSALEVLQRNVRSARLALGMTQTEAARHVGHIGPDETLGGGGFMWFETAHRVPSREEYARLKLGLGLNDDCDEAFLEAERHALGSTTYGDSSIWGSANGTSEHSAALSDLGREWQGWGTALKPAWEPIILARKPFPGTVARNVIAHGVGALNIDGCRIGADSVSTHSRGTNGAFPKRPGETSPSDSGRITDQRSGLDHSERVGRWPANVLLDEAAAAMLDEQTGELSSGAWNGNRNTPKTDTVFGDFALQNESPRESSTGGASRFFYTAKASRSERDAGLLGIALPQRDATRNAEQPSMNDGDGNPYNRGAKPVMNDHPTVKPIDVMRWLVRLVTPGRGPVLDPFAGSGTTGAAAVLEWCDVVLVDLDESHARKCELRAGHWREAAIAERAAWQIEIGGPTQPPARPVVAPIMELDLWGE